MASTPTCPRCGSTNVSRHAEPPPLGQPNPYDSLRDEGYRCKDCEFQESRWNSADDYEEFKTRWNDWREFSFQELKESVERTNRILEQQEREWTWPDEEDVTDRETRAKKLAENMAIAKEIRNSDSIWHKRSKRSAWSLPQNPSLFNRIIQDPDDAAVRFEFARWMRAQPDPFAEYEDYKIPRTAQVANFIETQLKLATLAHAEARDLLVEQVGRPNEHEFLWMAFTSKDRANWWRYPSYDLANWPGGETVGGGNLSILRDEGLIADLRWYRGFVEHVAVKAQRFLEIADELFSLAPIRYLTITYTKGLDHNDEGLWRALMESPHLERIRSLRLPVSILQNQYTELNRLTDADMELLAASPRLRGLRHLDLEDERHLTVRAFDAVASSKTLVELSAIQFDTYYYEHAGAFTFGNFGPRTRTLIRRPLSLYAKQLEERHGHIVWLHPLDYYGTEEPDPEAVVEHPAALLRPNVPRSH